MAIRRLGPVDHALTAGRYFPQDLARRIANDGQFKESGDRVCPLILVQGTIEHADSGNRANRINVLGVGEEFMRLGRTAEVFGDLRGGDVSVILNEPLARRLQVKPGEDVLIRMGSQGTVPAETLLGRRDEKTVSLRLTVTRVIPAEGWGCFNLTPSQQEPCNAFVPLAALERAIKQRGRVNTILVAGGGAEFSADSRLRQVLGRQVQISDLGLRLRRDEQRGYVALESESLLIPPVVEMAGFAAANTVHAPPTSVLTYLANSMSVDSSGPVSTQPSHDRVSSNGAAGRPEHTGYSVAPSGLTDIVLVSTRGLRPWPHTFVPSAQESGQRVGYTEVSHGGGRVTPYSTVAAIETGEKASLLSMTLVDGGAAPALKGNEILLNEWAAEDLQAHSGDTIRMSYYVMGPFGQLRTEEATFILRGVVRLSGPADDPGLVPEYEGVTNAKHMTDWDPPFPIDLKRIRPKDEAYWERYRATPKAFISLRRGQVLWAQESTRFGRLTQIRFGPSGGKDLATTAAEFERELLKRLAPESMGLAFEPVRAQAIAASQGSTDFSMLFMSFSMFLILSAAMLVALVFRLGVERRSSELGILLTVGLRPRSIAIALLFEGAVLAGIGSVVGLAGAIGYARLLLAGLTSWWADAASVTGLQLHVRGMSLLTGWAASFIVGLGSIAWAVRGLSRMSVRSLLSGNVESDSRTPVHRQVSMERHGRTVYPSTGGQAASATRPARRPGRTSRLIAVAALVTAIILIVLAAIFDAIPRTAAFFGSGAALLIAALAALTAWTGRAHRAAIAGTGLMAITRLGIRNAARNRRRSLLTAGLIASATFVIIAVGANRQEVGKETLSRQSGTGGFTLVAESTSPILYSLNTAEGREALGLRQATRDVLEDATVLPFRLRSGDEASCLNLYQPRQPRILGATATMIERGGFAFKSTLAQDDEARGNPWKLLTRPLADGAIPAIADDNTVTWLLHLGLGKDLRVTDGRGREVRLRFVGLLAGSILQGEVMVAESRFVELFPSVGGYGFFLIDTPATEECGRELTRDLANYGLETTSATERLARYLAVENAYLSAFQTLGGLGMVLGTLGLAAVLLRAVLERRGELALLQAVGWRRLELIWLVLAENSALLLSGLAAGAVSAIVAVAPHVASNVEKVPWASLALALAGAFLVGTTAAAMAVVAVMRSPLVPSLRAE